MQGARDAAERLERLLPAPVDHRRGVQTGQDRSVQGEHDGVRVQHTARPVLRVQGEDRLGQRREQRDDLVGGQAARSVLEAPAQGVAGDELTDQVGRSVGDAVVADRCDPRVAHFGEAAAQVPEGGGGPSLRIPAQHDERVTGARVLGEPARAARALGLPQQPVPPREQLLGAVRRQPPDAVLADRGERIALRGRPRAPRGRDRRPELARRPARPAVDELAHAVEEFGGAVAVGAGQAEQQQFAYAVPEGVGTGRNVRGGGEHPAENHLGQVLGARIGFDGGLDQAHHRQVGAAHREMAGQPERLRGGGRPEPQDQFLGGQQPDVRTVLGVRRQRAPQPGDRTREFPAARGGEQPGPVREPPRLRLQDGKRDRAAGHG